MPASKCPTCGYSNGQTAQRCMNCGEALSTPASSLSTALVPKTLQPMHQGSEVQSESFVFASSDIVKQTEEEDSPYQAQIQSLAPFENIPALSIDSQTTPTLEPPTRLPFGFAWNKPKLVGKVIHAEPREQINDFPNFVGAILAIIAEIIWVIPNVGTTREPIDKIEVTRLRVQSENGQIHDATVRGSLRGANLTMGDTVSLWGHRRKGNLIVKKGYNHTTRSTISMRATGSLMPALLILVVVAVLYLYLSHLSLGDAFHQLLELPDWFKKQIHPFFNN